MVPAEPYEHDSNPTTDARLSSLEQAVKDLQQSQSDTLAAVAVTVEKVDGLAVDLSQNSAKTDSVYEIAQMYRGAGKVIQGVGAVIKWGATVAAALVAMWAAFKGVKG